VVYLGQFLICWELLILMMTALGGQGSLEVNHG